MDNWIGHLRNSVNVQRTSIQMPQTPKLLKDPPAPAFTTAPWRAPLRGPMEAQDQLSLGKGDHSLL